MNRKCKRGMTLVELLVAIAVLGIIAVSFLAIFTNSYSTIFTYGRKTKATMTANSLMDQIYKNSFSQSVPSAVDNALNVNYSATKRLATSLTDVATQSVDGEKIRYYVSPSTQSGVTGYVVALTVFEPRESSGTLVIFIP